MLKETFPSFKISNFSGGEIPQNPQQATVPGACLLAPPPPQYKILSAVPDSFACVTIMPWVAIKEDLG